MQHARRSGQSGPKPTAHEKAFLIGYAIARARPDYVGQVLRGVLRASNEINDEAEAAKQDAANKAATETTAKRHGDCAVKPPRESQFIECVPFGRGGYDHE